MSYSTILEARITGLVLQAGGLKYESGESVIKAIGLDDPYGMRRPTKLVLA
jgi:hypothetical protein